MPASPDSNPGTGSDSRAFSFGDLGKPRASARLLPPIKDADPDASSELELGNHDILESQELEIAVGSGFDVDVSMVAAVEVESFSRFDAAGAQLQAEPAPAPQLEPEEEPSPSEMRAALAETQLDDDWTAPESAQSFDAPDAPDAGQPPAPVAIAPLALAVAPVPDAPSEPAPVLPSTLIGMPAAPLTSPLPFEESVIVSEPDEDDDSDAVRTQELGRNHLAQVAQAAALLDHDPHGPHDLPERTQVLVRQHMPAALGGQAFRAPSPTPPPTSVHTPLAPAAGAWTNGRHPQSGSMATPGYQLASLAPLALDSARGLPPGALRAAAPAPSRTNVLLVAGLCFAAAALVGIVGVGGYLASRSLSEKSVAIAPAPVRVDTVTTTAAVAPVSDPAAGTVDPAAGANTAAPAGVVLPPAAFATPAVAAVAAAPGAGVVAAPVSATPAAGGNGAATLDVSALPSAPRGSARGAAGAHGVVAPPPSPPAARAGAPLPPPPAVAAPPPPPVANAGATAPLPPPPAKAAPAAAPAAPQATTGNVTVDPALRAVVVDGNFHRVNDGVVTLSCGTHRIKVGMNDPQTVNVPCGGNVGL